MQLNRFMEGLEILRKYIDDPENPNVFSAEHDEFYVYCDREISKADQKTLDKLGWCDNEDNQENSWLAFQ